MTNERLQSTIIIEKHRFQHLNVLKILLMQKSVVFVSSKLGEGSRLSSAGHAGVPGLVRPVELLLQLPLRGARSAMRSRLRACAAWPAAQQRKPWKTVNKHTRDSLKRSQMCSQLRS